MEKVEKHLVSNFQNILIGKFYNFKKKSIWKYLLSSFLFAIVKPDIFGSFYTTLLGIFFSLITISIISMIISAKIWDKKINFDAIVEFQKNEIIIKHLNSDLVEKKSWDWVKGIKIEKDIVFIEINQYPPFVLFISKNTEEELYFFENINLNA